MLEQVHHDADRVTRLVTELLDISRLETGRLVLRRQMVDLPALARSRGREGGHGDPRARLHAWRSPPTSRASTPTPTRSSRCSPTWSRTPPSTAAPRRCGSTGEVDDGRGGGRRARHRRGHPGRGPAPGVHQVLPARPRPAHRHRPRALDQPGPGRGPRRPAHGRVHARARAAPSGSPSPPTPSSASWCAEPIGEPRLLSGEHPSQCCRTSPPSRPTPAPRIAAAATLDELRALDQELLGKRSPLSAFKAKLGGLDADERREVGGALNRVRDALEAALAARRAELEAVARREQLAAERLDLTEVAARPRRRSPAPRHPGDGDARGRVRRDGLHRRRGPRGRDRLAQLRRAQLPARPPGPRHVRHALRRDGRARAPPCCAPTPRRCRSG